MTTQVALVGCAHIHTLGFVKRLQARPAIGVAAVWDHDAARAAQNAAALDAPTVDDPDAIWSDEAIDAVIVCSETNMHEQLVLPARRCRQAPLCRKTVGHGRR